MLSIIDIHVHDKLQENLVHFYMLISLKQFKWLKFVKISFMVKNSFIEKTLCCMYTFECRIVTKYIENLT